MIELFLHALTSYFVIIDPIGAALIFNGLTTGRDKKYINTMAFKSVCISIGILLACGFFGEALFAKLGITINALKVSGGLLLFYTAFKMITSMQSSVNQKVDEEDNPPDISVYPMSIPLTAGPGCITVTILLFSKSTNPLDTLSLCLAIIFILFATGLAMITSTSIRKIIGKTGDDILQRLLGVILAALAIQFIVDGIKSIIA